MSQIKTTTNSKWSGIFMDSITKLHEEKIREKEKRKRASEENKKRSEEKRQKEEKKFNDELDSLPDDYQKIRYIKKRISMQRNYISFIKGHVDSGTQIQKVIRVLNMQNTKKIADPDQKTYKYEVNSRKVLRELIKYINTMRSIHSEWTHSVKSEIANRRELLKEYYNE
tara:strand:- start:37 stop:543 length:507 start_codon:yes stop_codon:yes gene_type:complete